MQDTQVTIRALMLLMWTIILSCFTAILSAVPLRLFRQIAGNTFYWLIMVAVLSLFIVLGWLPLAIILGAQTLLVGIYTELEEREFTLGQASSFSVFLTSLLICSMFYIWAVITGKIWFVKITEGVEQVLTRAVEMKLTFLSQVKAVDIVFQIPSAVVIFLILSLGVSLIFEKFFSRNAAVKSRRIEKLSDYRTPDAFIWFFIVSLLGAFAEHKIRLIEIVSINTLNIMATAYFFQGLAVLFKYFEAFKIGFFWRAIWVLLLVIQLPVLMGILGVVDYWANFRRVIVKKAAEVKKRRIQE